MKQSDKLHVKWSIRERDLIINFPLGIQTKCDGHFLASKVFSKEITDDLEKRGYDLTTLKFSIEPKKGDERFASQRTTQE